MSTTTKSKAVALGSATLTGSAAVVGDPGTFDCRNNTTVSLRLTYTKVSATLARVIVEGTLAKDDWTNPFEVPIALDLSGALSAGAVDAPLGKMRYTIDTTGVYHLPVEVAGAHQIRVKALETGTPGGTLAVSAVGVQEAQ